MPLKLEQLMGQLITTKDETQIEILKQLAEEMGYRLVKKERPKSNL